MGVDELLFPFHFRRAWLWLGSRSMAIGLNLSQFCAKQRNQG
jgi:hypothetical protein